MKYLTGDDYPALCDKCRATITVIAGICEELPSEYADDEEGPCNFAYDHGLLCGGYFCNKEWLVEIEEDEDV